MNTLSALWAAALFLAVAVSQSQAAEDRRERVLNDRKDVEAGGGWIYNDLRRAMEVAARSGKPLLVVLRCVP